MFILCQRVFFFRHLGKDHFLSHLQAMPVVDHFFVLFAHEADELSHVLNDRVKVELRAACVDSDAFFVGELESHIACLYIDVMHDLAVPGSQD